MKRFTALLIIIVGFALWTDAQAGIADEFKDAHYGMHLLSDHADNRGTNNGNLGFYIRTKSGWTAGHYKNSCNTFTNYYGWTSPEWYRISISPVIATGYHCLTEKVGVEEGKRISFTLVPTIRIATWEGVLGAREVSIRGMFVPGLYHLMAEVKF